jgi:hypothetical protein
MNAFLVNLSGTQRLFALIVLFAVPGILLSLCGAEVLTLRSCSALGIDFLSFIEAFEREVRGPPK